MNVFVNGLLDAGTETSLASLRGFQNGWVSIVRCSMLLLLVVLVGCQPGDRLSELIESAASEADPKKEEPVEPPIQIEPLESPPDVLLVEAHRYRPSLGGRLPIELVRQMLLTVGREDFDLHTTDPALGEIVPRNAGRPLTLKMSLSLGGPHGKPKYVNIAQFPDDDSSTLDTRILRERIPDDCMPPSFAEAATDPDFTPPDLEATVEAVVDLSDEFGEMYSALGIERPERPAKAPVDEQGVRDIGARQREMSLVPQFEAVRLAHALAPSPAKERLLAVGYANLALLTEHHWSSLSKAFYARGLVYAERASRAEPGADSEEVQAYVTALAGLHSAALRHLNQIEKAGADLSPRARAISAYCHYRDEELVELAKSSPEVNELALVLSCLVAKSSGDLNRLSELFQKTFESCPNCFRVYDLVYTAELPGMAQHVSLRGPTQLTEVVPQRLGAIEGLPRSIRQALTPESMVLKAKAIRPARVADALELYRSDLSRTQEPSWPVLGRLIRDEALVQAERRLHCLTAILGLPTGYEHGHFENFVGRHPLAEAACAMYADETDPKSLQREVLTLFVVDNRDRSKPDSWQFYYDFGPAHLPMLRNFIRSNGPESNAALLWRVILNDADWTANDIAVLQAIDRSGPIAALRHEEIDAFETMAFLSPHNPSRYRVALERGTATPEQMAAWEETFQNDPILLGPLARALAKEEKFEDAVRVARRAAEIDPSHQTFQTLAEVHEAAGQEEARVAALEQAALYPDPASESLPEIAAIEKPAVAAPKPTAEQLASGNPQPVDPSGPFILSTGATTNPYVGRLATELFRQTVLLVAAEDFGLPIRDESLVAPRSEEKTVNRFDASACVIPPDFEKSKTHWAVEIRRHTHADVPEFSDRAYLGLVPKENSPRQIGMYHESFGPVKYVDLGETAEVYHELAPGIISALEKAGFQAVEADKRAVLSDEDKSRIGDIELRLREMTFVSQFEALRSAHELPATPERHRLLAYGYANLGLLTRHHWSSRHKVFFARGLVHAERAFRDDPGDASNAARAYARALAGLHGSALEILQTREADPTPRVEAVEAFCQFRKDDLLALAEAHPEIGELATLMACIVVDAAEDRDGALEVYEAAVTANPNCFRVYDSIAALGLIALMHDVTARGPGQLAIALPARLRAMDDLPEAVRDAIDAESVLPGDLADAMQSVEEKNADHGVDWRLLGGLIRDEALVQTQRRLSFMSRTLGVSTAGARERFADFVGGHELAILAMEPFSDAPDWNRIAGSAEEYIGRRRGAYEMETSDVGPDFSDLLRFVLTSDIPTATNYTLLNAMTTSSDWIARDIVLVADIRTRRQSSGDRDAAAALDGLATISPHHPRRFLREMRGNDVSPEQLAELEAQIAERPVLLSRLAAAMMERRLTEDALRVATRVTELSPSYESFRALARLHLRNGDQEKYIKTLEQAVEFPSPSLSPAQSRVTIAYHYMEQEDYERAEPYATKAAESGAEWAMNCVIDCLTGLEKYDLAEEWHVRRLQRYGHTPDYWYTWCVATGQGDIDTARKLVEAKIAPWREKPMEELTKDEAIGLGSYYSAEGHDAAAADLWALVSRREKNPARGLHAALLYLRAGERPQAIALLRRCVGWTTLSEKAPAAARRAGLFLKSLESGEPLKLSEIEQLDRDIDTYAVHEQIFYHAIYGDLFFYTGNPEQGIDFLKQSVAFAPRANIWFANYDRAVATVWLRERLNAGSEPPSDAPPAG